MKRPAFIEGALFAFVASLVASFLYASLLWIFSELFALKLIISLTGFSYVLYLLSRSDEKTGRVVITFSWIFMAVLFVLIDVPLPLFSLVHLVMIWLIRSLYYYASIVSTLMDFALVALSLILSSWAFYHTGSLLMSLWSFFLMQTLFVLIPEKIGQSRRNISTEDSDNHKFTRAFNNANDAVRKLSASR